LVPDENSAFLCHIITGYNDYDQITEINMVGAENYEVLKLKFFEPLKPQQTILITKKELQIKRSIYLEFDDLKKQ